MSAWHDFFVAEAGASAALAGLLFVALSLNIARILKDAWLVPRAAQSIGALMIALLISLIALVPLTLNQAGLWWLIVGCAGTAFAARATVAQATVPEKYRRYTIGNAVANLVLYVALVTGALIVTSENPVGINVVTFAVIYALLYGVYNAWVLLVEILR
jgi:hypothetical protein